MAGAISYIGNIALYSMMFGGGSRNSKNGNASILALIAIILVPIGASFIQLGIGRNDEYNADEYGARLTRNPGGLISALTKIEAQVKTKGFGRSGGRGPGPTTAGSGPSPATASLWIVNPFRGSSLMELFSTHPSMSHRVERLKRIAREMSIYVP
jgi:heat shock protein HtpX